MDGSHFSDVASAEAAVLARGTGAKLLLVHVVSEARLISLGPPEAEDLELCEQLDQRNQQIAADFLEESIRRMARQRLEARALTLKGETRTKVQQAITETKPSLVVLAARGQGGVHCANLSIGSTANYLIEHLAAPTMIIPTRAQMTERPLAPVIRNSIPAPTIAA